MGLYANVQRLCKINGIAITHLEESLGFSRGSIGKWDTNAPSIQRVKMVADALGVTVDVLIKGAL